MSLFENLRLVEVEPLPCELCREPAGAISFAVADLIICRYCYAGRTDDELDTAAIDAEWNV